MMQKQFFWITNISNRNVSLADLNLTVKAFASINLLDSKHYHYNINELQESAKHGSIYAKRNKIVVRDVAPEMLKMNAPLLAETYIPSRERSTYVIENKEYEELQMTDEDFAKENADIVELDSIKPVISRG